MTDRELERQLKHAVSSTAPDDVESVLARCKAREGTVIPLRPRRRSGARALIAACLALALAGGAGGVVYQQAYAVASVVSLDVNPSVKLEVNRMEKVISAEPMNGDGEQILAGMELKGTPAGVAVNAIIGSLLRQGYVDELANSILITVEDENIQRGQSLQQTLTAQAGQSLNDAQIQGAILSQTLSGGREMEAKAAEYGISAGKAALIQAVVEASGQTKTFEDLVGLTINELNLLYAAGQTGMPEEDAPLDTVGEASQSAYIGSEAAKQAALSDAGLSASQVSALRVEYDYEDGRMIYEVEFYTGLVEHEYEIDALTGRVLKGESDREEELFPGGQSAGAYGDIGGEAAKNAALNHAGVPAGDTSEMKVERDEDDGRPEYEVEFRAGGTEYEYVIDGQTGAVLSYEQDG